MQRITQSSMVKELFICLLISIIIAYIFKFYVIVKYNHNITDSYNRWHNTNLKYEYNYSLKCFYDYLKGKVKLQ